MQAEGLWLGIGIGVGLGAAYVAASYVSNKRALRSKRHPMLIVVTTMLLRIFVALVVLIGIMMLLPVAPTALLGSFFVMFLVGLAAEVWILHRKGSGRTGTGSRS